MKLVEMYDGVLDEMLYSEYRIDESLHSMFQNGFLLESIAAAAKQAKRLAGRETTAAFMENGDGEYVAYTSVGSKASMVHYDRNKNVIGTEELSKSQIKQHRRGMEASGFRPIIDPRKLRIAVKIALGVVAVGLIIGGVWLTFGPVISLLASSMWGLITFVGSALVTAGSGLMSFFSAVGSGIGVVGGGGGGISAIGSFFSNLAVSAISVVGGIITLSVVANDDEF